MRLPDGLVEGRLVRRWKRFLAEVELPGVGRVTAHCPNPGAMQACMEPGGTVLLAPSGGSGRKLAWSWKLSRMGGTWVLVDTGLANRVVEEGLLAGRLPALAGYEQVDREVRYGARSRVDFVLRGAGRPDCYVEVKSVTLAVGGVAWFPDAVTERGARHLDELAGRVAAGDRAVLLFLVGRGDADRVRPARRIDPHYAARLAAAADAGVELLAWRAVVGPDGVGLERPVPVEARSDDPGPARELRATTAGP